MQTLRIVFMGTPDFAVPCLQTLLDSPHSVVGVFTQPDRPQGRKMVLTPPPVKVLAAENGVPVFQPEKMKDPATLEQLKILAPDLIVVVAYGRILPRAVLELPRYGCINVHASLLPKYRGAAPIQWAILDGETETGVTIMQMDAGLDTGDMLLVKKTPIDPEETAEMAVTPTTAMEETAETAVAPTAETMETAAAPAVTVTDPAEMAAAPTMAMEETAVTTAEATPEITPEITPETTAAITVVITPIPMGITIPEVQVTQVIHQMQVIQPAMIPEIMPIKEIKETVPATVMPGRRIRQRMTA